MVEWTRGRVQSILNVTERNEEYIRAHVTIYDEKAREVLYMQ